jgi:RsiW-degrading membrane proteinase PrsW (M82 family)
MSGVYGEVRSPSPSLIAPPQEEEARYPFARVWVSVRNLIAGTFILAIAGYALLLFGIEVDPDYFSAIHLIIATLPGLLWFIFARFPESRAEIPRTGLASTFVVAALVANGLALPFLNSVMRLEEWLPLADPLTRLIGYTLSVGVVQELSKYMVVRAIVWENRLYQRVDAIAYYTAAAVGYASAVSLAQALTRPSTPAFATFDTFTTFAFSLAPSLLVSYALAETRLARASAFLLPSAFALAALLYGLLVTIRGLLTNAALTLAGQAQVSAPSPLIGVAIAALAPILIAVVVSFLIANAERRELEIRSGG